jgi:hypothetical protein
MSLFRSKLDIGLLLNFSMIRYIYIIFFQINFCLSIFAQNTTATIENVAFDVVNKKLTLTYDITRYSPVERFQISLLFINDKNDTLKPITIRGDIGKDIRGGKGKKVVWDFLKDGIKLKGMNLKSIVKVAGVSEIPGGPSNALLSLIIPGLGDRYVSNSRKSIVKPYYETIAVCGLMGFGIFQKFQSNSFYDKYLKATKTSDINSYYSKANTANHYFYVFTALGAAVWTADVAWVLYRGMKKSKTSNEKVKVSFIPATFPETHNSGIALSLKIDF